MTKTQKVLSVLISNILPKHLKTIHVYGYTIVRICIYYYA